MSDERPIFARWRYPFAEIEGKKILIIEFFEARHWRLRQGVAVYPSPKEWQGGEGIDWSAMFRVRINGRWFGPRKWSFFTMIQAAQIVTRIIATGKCHDHTLVELTPERSGNFAGSLPAVVWGLNGGRQQRASARR